MFRRYAVFFVLAVASITGCLPDGVSDDDGVAPDSGPSDAAVHDAGPAPHDGGPVPIDRDEWWRDDVFYEVFVRSFQDSDGDGVGDLAGLTSRLDYLNDGDPNTTDDLGVDGIWLMPIQPSPSYHGYDVTNYEGINPDYGTLEDFETLVADAHDRGIRIVLDFVVNHSSRNHPWFVGARSGASNQFRDYYLWRSDDPGWIPPVGLGPDLWHPSGAEFYYGVFGGGLPDLNHTNEAVYQEILAIARLWLSRGVDGFRFDAVRYLFEDGQGAVADLDENHVWFKRLKREVLADYPDALFLVEAWTGNAKVAAYYGAGDEVDLAFNFDQSQGLQEATQTGNVRRLTQALDAARTQFSDRGFEAPFITNHDMNRLMRDGRVDQAAFSVAAATLLALPGTPFIYYGEEIGMKGGALEVDEDKRTPFRWTADAPTFGFSTGTPWRSRTEDDGIDVATQRRDDGSLWRLVQRAIAVRRAAIAPHVGKFARAEVTNGGDGVVALIWGEDPGQTLFVANFARTAATGVVVGIGSQTATLLPISTSSVTATATANTLRLDLPATSFGYVTLE